MRHLNVVTSMENSSVFQNDSSTWNCSVDCFTTQEVTTTGTAHAEQDKNPVLVILDYINYGLLPFLLLLGLTGNTLTLLVMNTKKFANQTSRLFLTALSISDTTLLLAQPFNKAFVIQLFGVDLRALSDVGCKIFFVAFRTAKMTSSWFLVFLCLERFIAVWFPLKAKMICTKRVALAGIFVVYSSIGIYNSVWSYASKIVHGNVCHPDQYDRSNWREVEIFGRFIITGLTIYSIIPTIILAIVTPLIIIRITSRAKMMRKMTTKTKRQQADKNKITIMLVGVMVAYIALISPVTALHMTAYFARLNAFGVSSTGFMIFREVSQMLEQVNYAINFFLYILTSSTFRGALYDVVCIRKINNYRKSLAGSKSKFEKESGSSPPTNWRNKSGRSLGESSLNSSVKKNGENKEVYTVSKEDP